MSDDLRTDPAPNDAMQRLDLAAVESGIVSHFGPDEIELLRTGQLRWALQGFDDIGMANVEVFTTEGVALMSFLVHWSAVVGGV